MRLSDFAWSAYMCQSGATHICPEDDDPEWAEDVFDVLGPAAAVFHAVAREWARSASREERRALLVGTSGPIKVSRITGCDSYPSGITIDGEPFELHGWRFGDDVIGSEVLPVYVPAGLGEGAAPTFGGLIGAAALGALVYGMRWRTSA